MVDYDGNSAVAIAGGCGLYVWAFAGANAWNIIGQVVLVGMAVVTIVLAIKIASLRQNCAHTPVLPDIPQPLHSFAFSTR